MRRLVHPNIAAVIAFVPGVFLCMCVSAIEKSNQVADPAIAKNLTAVYILLLSFAAVTKVISWFLED